MRALGVRVVQIHEVAHAMGEVAARAMIGDLHRAPGLVGIEEDEQVGGAATAILVVVALGLARHGRDRQPGLADELGWAHLAARSSGVGSGPCSLTASAAERKGPAGVTTCLRVTTPARMHAGV
jgi:hypothetical protein